MKRWIIPLAVVGLVGLGVLRSPLEAASKKAGSARTGMTGSVRVAASSVAKEGNRLLSAESAFDGDLATVWQEAAPGGGNGEWLEVEFKTPRSLSSVTIFGGAFASSTAFFEHNHLAEADLEVEHKTGTEKLSLLFPDRYEPLRVELGRDVKRLRLMIRRQHAGSVYSDGRVAELAFNLDVKDPTLMAALDAWKRSKPGEAALGAYKAQLEAAQLRAEGGERGALQPLLEAVRRGPEPVRAWLSKQVPLGSMLTYLDPDPDAMEALKKLGALEAVPALEQAAFLVDDVDVPAIRRLSSFLRASAELKRPLRTSLPRFGTPGFEPGALQGNGVPLSLAADRDDYVFVADVANNRVQRFDPDGRFERSTGTSPVLQETFLEREVPFYVAGNRPGVGPGQFTQPLAIAAGSKDRIAVLDASRRITLMDFDLHALETWSLPDALGLELNPESELPRLLWLKNRLYVFWGVQGLVYDERGKLTRSYKLDRPVRAVAGLDRLLLVHHGGRALQRYGLDGVHFGEFAVLPEGEPAEGLELAFGSDKRLYVHSDHGTLYRFDVKGKLLGSAPSFENPAPPYRLTVGQLNLWLTSQDRIHPFPLTRLNPPMPQ